MEQNKKTRVVIAGGGTAGWMAAASLGRQLNEELDIVLVESEEIGTVGVGEATIPPMCTFHRFLRIDEQEFMRATEATFKLGIQFENWGQIGDNYIHSFGKTGEETWLAGFIHFWLRGKELGVANEFGEYCLEWLAAREHKCGFDANNRINYAYHLDASRYAKFLRTIAEKAGVKRVEGKIHQVIQNTSNGFVESLRMQSGELVSGDLFIDCTGFQGILIEQTLFTGYDDWTHWLPCDRAVAVQTASVRPPAPYTRSIAHESGWRWQIPLQHRVGNGTVFCSRFMSEDEATAKLLSEIEGETLIEPRVIRFRTGKRRRVWNKNVVALGLASGFLEPLESTSIHLIMMGITRLMQLFPFSGIREEAVNEFNRQSEMEMEKIRDFIILHYKATDRTDSPFWRFCRLMDVPDTLAQRIELFKNTAHAFQGDSELFRVDSWIQVMLGQGIMPKSYHHFARIMNDRKLKEFLNNLSQDMHEKVAKMPEHDTFLRQYCGVDYMR
ncbi:MAG TPA: tryptophan halogenase family protein [Cellvibrionaceae bacterium]